MASPETVKRVTGAEVGYAGFLDLPPEVRVVLDESVAGRKNFEVGANKTNFHSINVNFDRDYPTPEKFYDIALAKAGYLAPGGQQKLVERRGIEVGNIFQLGYHYSRLMKGAGYTDADGTQKPYYMGCYGIGIGRTLAAIVEKYHDDKGIVWPAAVAPFQVYLVGLGDGLTTAEKIYQELLQAGIEVLFDDREKMPGEKFADADLLGLPWRVVISAKTLAHNAAEVKARACVETTLVPLTELTEWLKAK